MGKRENERNNRLGKSNRSAHTPFENLLHMLHFFSKRMSPAGLLVSENIRSSIYSVLTNRETLFPTVQPNFHILYYFEPAFIQTSSGKIASFSKMLHRIITKVQTHL